MRLRFNVESMDTVADGGYLLTLGKRASLPQRVVSTLVGNSSGTSRETAVKGRDEKAKLVREETDWLLPAIAAIPGNKGLDRYEMSRKGLAECVVMCRAIQMSDGSAPESDGITFVHHEALQQMFSEGDSVEVHVIARVHDFFLGLNAGTWLKIRMQQIAQAAQHHVQQHHSTLLASSDCSTAEDVLRAGGLVMKRQVDLPPPDAAYLFDHWGAGGNSGVSGQRCLPSGLDPVTSPGGVGADGNSREPRYVPWAYRPLTSQLPE